MVAPMVAAVAGGTTVFVLAVGVAIFVRRHSN
jgi:hypothetical protein